MQKKNLFFLSLLIGLVAVSFALYVASYEEVGEITSPHSFDFDSYAGPGSDADLISDLKTLFPMGTDRGDVEEVLVKQAGAESRYKSSNQSLYIARTGVSGLGGWKVYINYDNNKVKSITVE